ncbi:hypothetical protein D3C78_1521690 [compost metagenome]
MLGPQDVLLRPAQIGLQLLHLPVALVKYRVEVQFAQAQLAHLATGLGRPGQVGIGQMPAETVGRGVAEDQQNFLAHGVRLVTWRWKDPKAKVSPGR